MENAQASKQNGNSELRSLAAATQGTEGLSRPAAPFQFASAAAPAAAGTAGPGNGGSAPTTPFQLAEKANHQHTSVSQAYSAPVVQRVLNVDGANLTAFDIEGKEPGQYGSAEKEPVDDILKSWAEMGTQKAFLTYHEAVVAASASLTDYAAYSNEDPAAARAIAAAYEEAGLTAPRQAQLLSILGRAQFEEVIGLGLQRPLRTIYENGVDDIEIIAEEGLSTLVIIEKLNDSFDWINGIGFEKLHNIISAGVGIPAMDMAYLKMAVGHVAALDVQVFKTILTYGADLVSDIDDEFGSLRPFFKSTTELAFLKQILDYDRSCEDIGAVAKVFPNPQKIAEAFKANRYGSVKDLISVVKGG